ncbi:hypothetical protein ABZ791_00370 [Streptomyces huasconensis]|uniref:Uncharacterized protein n=1 Tax=Streptomyces huasconensis TaxID=1854574 RepID=A0ABV3LSL8_9ACTN
MNRSQPPPRRTDGWFTSDAGDPDKQIRLHVVANGPSPLVPDRIYQRTGPTHRRKRESSRSSHRPQQLAPSCKSLAK